MSKGILILAAAMTALAGGLSWASGAGLGVPEPVKKPVSIREGSVRGGHTGTRYRRSRYFVGGGTFSGK